MSAPPKSRIALGERVVDLDAQFVIQEDQRIRLTDGEVALLRVLAAADGEPVSRERLLTEGLGYNPGVKSRAVDYAVNRLRRKLEERPSEPLHLQSEFGVGYRLAAAGTANAVFLPDEPLIGRTADLARLGNVVRGHRLVTVTGAGGVGKTRLVTTWADSHPEAIHCDLGAATDLADMVSTVARGLGLRLAGDSLLGRVAQIGRVVRARDNTILVLDGFEQLDESCAEAISSWVDDASEFRVVLTSRRALGLESEKVLPLSPLASGPAFHLLRTLLEAGDEQAEELKRLAELVEGIPLALEIAAAAARRTDAGQVVEALAKALAAEATHPHEDPRAAKLRAVVAWAVEELEPATRRAFAACGTFVGGFERDAWSTVVGTDELLEVLGDEGLVASLSGRCQLLEPIRQLAAQELEAHPDKDLLRASHARYYAKRSEEPVVELRLEGRSVWMEREQPNILAAISNSLSPLPSVAVRAGIALDELQIADSPAEERVRRLSSLLEAAERTTRPLQAEVHRRLADALRRVGQADEGLRYVRSSLVLAESAGDQVLAARCTQTLGSIELARGHYAEAKTELEHAATALEAAGHPYWAAVARFNLGTTLQIMGDSDRAEEAYRLGLAHADEAGATWLRPTIGSGLAVVFLERGQAGKAKLLLERALAQGRGRIARLYELHLERNLGHADLSLGELRSAAMRFAQLVRDARSFGEPFLLADALVGSARADALRGRHQAALDGFAEARALYALQGRPTFEGMAIVHGAMMAHLVTPDVDARPRIREGLERLAPSAAASRVEALCYLAVVSTTQGDDVTARAMLEQADRLAEPGKSSRLLEISKQHRKDAARRAEIFSRLLRTALG